MNARKILTRTAVTGALVAVPLVAVVGTASADPIHDSRGDQNQQQQQFELPQFQLPEIFQPQAQPEPQPAPAPLPEPTALPQFGPTFWQGFSTGSAG